MIGFLTTGFIFFIFFCWALSDLQTDKEIQDIIDGKEVDLDIPRD